MPLVIQEVLPRSLAARNGIRAGDTLLSINGHEIRDFIDLQFYSSGGELNCEVMSEGGEVSLVRMVRRDRTNLGIEPESYKFERCRNRCVFCFIDQMPPRLRDPLYIKDDDYLYSFVFGNYITLNNLGESDFERISEQKLSPLYVSVHATNPALRRKLMGYRKSYDILSGLRRLSESGIALHCQIVLVPGWNDGKELERSLLDLLQPDLNVLSIGIVPVGLTKYRKNLTQLRGFNAREAGAAIDLAERVCAEAGTDNVYCADELFIKAGRDIPESECYGDFPQVENGIGMVRLLLESWKEKRRAFLRELRKKNRPLLLVTGVAASSYIQELADDITRRAECCPARVCTVKNAFMGRTVTVSGLLAFIDISRQADPSDSEIVALPGNIFNHEGLTLDGFSQLDIKEHWQRDILIIDPLFEDWEWI